MFIFPLRACIHNTAVTNQTSMLRNYMDEENFQVIGPVE